MNSKKLIQWTLTFSIVLLGLQYFTNRGADQQAQSANQALVITPASTEFTTGEEVRVNVLNNTQEVFSLESKCPYPPMKVLGFNGADFVEKTAETPLHCDQISKVDVLPGKTQPVTFNYWNHELFGTVGRYKVELTVPNLSTSASTETPSTSQTITSPEFTIVQAGTLRTFFRTVFYTPIYNAFVWIISVMPMHDLGLATIIITILIRLILLIPSQRALVSQRKMQALQPRLDKIKKEFAGNQERIAQETMKLWKENKINPFGSCLPLIIQLPFLIAVYYVIRNGLNPDNAHLLYGALKNFDFNSMNTMFLGILNLTKNNLYVLPVLVGMLQFIQLKLSFSLSDKMKKEKEALHPKKDEKPAIGDELAAANRSMMYFMPVMIAVFTASTPAGVGVYWATSTLFAIGQQLVVNRKV